MTPEGYHLWWFHSTRKAELDLAVRDRRLRRAEQELRQWQEKLRSPRSRHREAGKVQEAVDAILKDRNVKDLVQVRIEQCPRDTYRQERRGRPGKDTVYVKETSLRLDLHYTIDAEAVGRERLTDGIFPLVTNDLKLSALEVLHAYKHQPQIERRFEQLKTDFRLAPVFLKDVGRIEAFLCVYFFALLAEAALGAGTPPGDGARGAGIVALVSRGARLPSADDTAHDRRVLVDPASCSQPPRRGTRRSLD